jgi:adenine-specific DNA-methyltransferase
MDKKQLQDILSDPFELSKWQNLLKNIFGVKNFLQKPASIPLANNKKAEAVFELGSFNTADDRIIGLYLVKVKPEVWLERNKVGLRELLRSVYKYDVDGALIVFEQADKWRLSFVSEIRTFDDEGNVIKKITEPKRYTYLLGKGERTKTPVDRLFSVAGKKLYLEEIRNAFSVEALNEEFYKIVARHFYQLVGATEGKGAQEIHHERVLKLPSLNPNSKGAAKIYQEFAVRLIGRTVFCWFLKVKKSDAGISLLPEHLLSSEAVKKNNSYYHFVLEKLFFQTLNTPMDERISALPLGCEQIPFLNGGLFEPQTDDYYKANRKTGLSDNLNTLVIPDEWFKDFFENLEQYNFTIDENSVVDIEVSVDPEMLGRIFENLLAEIDPDSGETARKATGSFYTPREIVDYMATESLVHYLHNQTNIDNENLYPIFKIDSDISFSKNETEKMLEALDRLKILDPACGSGAFPMGVLQKIVMALQKLDRNAEWWKARQISRIENVVLRKQVKEKLQQTTVEYARKIGIIQNSLYGVDIQPIAAEISKLRCFLTLIVDENIDEHKPNRGVEPLPNLEFKFVTADALQKLPEEKDLGGLFNANDDLEELQQIRLDYLQSFGEHKAELKEQFEKIRNKIAKQQIRLGKNVDTNSRAYKISSWNPFSHEKADWFDPLWMYGIREFDVVIGNPPYVSYYSNTGSTLTKEQRVYYVKNYDSVIKENDRINSMNLFSERGFKLMNYPEAELRGIQLRNFSFFVNSHPAAKLRGILLIKSRRHTHFHRKQNICCITFLFRNQEISFKERRV